MKLKTERTTLLQKLHSSTQDHVSLLKITQGQKLIPDLFLL